MNIEINGNICTGIIKYCNKNTIDFIKIVEESIIQNQLRHNIDQEGNVYNNEDCECPDKNILKNLLKDTFCDAGEDIKEELLGIIYENIIIKNCKYIIGDFLDMYKLIFITTDDKLVEKIRNIKEIQNIKIEENQAYSWAASYKTKVIYKDTEDFKIILLKKV
jgi:hypothetical protein